MNSLNRFVGYFDILRRFRGAPPGARAGEGPTQPSNWWIVAHYFALYLGIIAKIFLDSLEDGKQFSISWVRLIVAAITATAIFPAVYEKAMAASGPGFVQCCVTFAAGLGYKTLIDVKV